MFDIILSKLMQFQFWHLQMEHAGINIKKNVYAIVRLRTIVIATPRIY